MEDYNQNNRIERKIDELQKMQIFAIDGIKIILQLAAQQNEIDFIEREIENPKGQLHELNGPKIQQYKQQLEEEQNNTEDEAEEQLNDNKKENENTFFQP